MKTELNFNVIFVFLETDDQGKQKALCALCRTDSSLLCHLEKQRERRIVDI